MTTDSSATQKLTPQEIISLVKERIRKIEQGAKQALETLRTSASEKQCGADHLRITAIQNELSGDNGTSNENTL